MTTIFRDGSRYRVEHEVDQETADVTIRYRGHFFVLTAAELREMGNDKKRRRVIKFWMDMVDKHKSITI